MSPTARIQMKQAKERDQSCLDCHKGIAHHLPENMDSSGGMISELEQLASNTKYEKDVSYTSVRHLPIYEDKALTVEAGLLNPASSVKIVVFLSVEIKQEPSCKRHVVLLSADLSAMFV